MNVDELDGEIRRALSEIGDAAGMAPGFDQLRIGRFGTSPGRQARPSRLRRLSLAAAAVMVIGAGLWALTLLAQRDGPPVATAPVTQAPASSATASAETEDSVVDSVPATSSTIDAVDSDPVLDTTDAIDLADLGAGSWLVATWLPDGYKLVMAMDLGMTPESTAHSTTYENPAGDRIVLGVDTGVTDLPPLTWTREAFEQGFAANARTDSIGAMVLGDHLDAVAFNRLLQGVVIGTIDDIPADAFLTMNGLTDGDPVAVYDHNGFPYAMWADGANGYYCVYGGGGGACPMWIEPGNVMTSHGGGSTAAAGGSTTIISSAQGIVKSVVDHIEVEFIDGQRISVKPTDLTGRFDDKFWIVAADIELDAPYDPSPDAPRLPGPVVSVTAYDRDGNILAVDNGLDQN